MAIGISLGIPFIKSGSILPETQAFINAAEITDSAIIQAVNTLVVALINNGLWDKMPVIYPFVGGTASTNSYNLKNPALYQITWAGTNTFSANGVLGDGITGYGNTNFVASTQMPSNQNNLRLSVCINNSNLGQNAIGATSGVVSLLLYPSAYLSRINGNAGIIRPETSPLGLTTANRLLASGTGARQDYKNGVATFSGTEASNGYCNLPLFLNARNLNGVASNFSPFRLCFATVGSSLSAAEEQDFFTYVTEFNTALGR